MSPSPHLAKILDLATAFEQQGDSQAAGILRARVRLLPTSISPSLSSLAPAERIGSSRNSSIASSFGMPAAPK